MNKILSPHKAFLYISILFGFLIIFVTPPFQVPDEINHFYRAWQVSTGAFSSVKQNQRLGGNIPKSLLKLTSQFSPYTLNPYNKMSPKMVWQTRLIVLNPNDTIFADFTNTALYSAFLYLPQAIAIDIGKLFEVNPFWFVYMGRFFNLLIFIIIVYYAIKIVPFKKWLFVLLATLPMSLSINSSLSADMLLNSLSFLFIAIILNLSFNETIHRITYKYILAIITLSVLIGLAKLVYVPILFLFGLIPSCKFKSNKVWFGIFAIVIITGFGTAYIQKLNIDTKYIPYNQYNEIYRDQTMLKKGVDINKQISFVKENPKYSIKIIVKSFYREFSSMTESYIGVLGWGDINLPTWYIYFAYLIIFFIVLINFQENGIIDLTLNKRIYIGLIVGSLLILIMLSQYLSWDIVGEGSIYPLQGRYFIPVFPLLFIMLSNVVKINISHKVQKNIEKGILIFCIFSGNLSVYLVAGKYTLYSYSHAKWKVNYTFKEMKNDTTSKISIDYIRSNGNVVAAFNKPKKKFISNERYFTGNNALKLSKNNPYGFTLKIFKGMAKDKIIVSCRTYGYGGFMVIQEIPNGIYYLSEKNYSIKDSLGWKYNETQFILPHNVTDSSELRIYEWYPGKDSIYVDDFSLTYFDKISKK